MSGFDWNATTTDKTELTMHVAQLIKQSTTFYPLNGFDILTVLAHVSGSVIADAPLTMRDKARDDFVAQVDTSITRHDADRE